MLGAVVLASKFILQVDGAVLCVSSRYRAVFYDPPLPPPRCLVHALRSTSMRYSKLRPLNPRCQLDLCRHESRYGCQREDNCSFAHSLVELKTWDLQKHTVRDMQQMYELWLRLTTQNRQADGTPLTSGGEEKQIVMPTDYAEDMQSCLLAPDVLLVLSEDDGSGMELSRLFSEIRTHYEKLVSSSSSSNGTGAEVPGSTAITQAGFHCRVCGKHSNGSRQWQEHISTEKHKEKLFIVTQEEEEESEGACWKHRFPGESFTLCSKLQDGSCPEGVACSSAHSEEELAEWRERRDFLRRRLQRAREDMLVAPSDNDFGKYSFLLQD
ncbi:UNVERIFIED_CONTAM: hypothetical protein FKN15_000612 [Acipenser sinensis]